MMPLAIVPDCSAELSVKLTTIRLENLGSPVRLAPSSVFVTGMPTTSFTWTLMLMLPVWSCPGKMSGPKVTGGATLINGRLFTRGATVMQMVGVAISLVISLAWPEASRCLSGLLSA
jgi:hypothetical protein